MTSERTTHTLVPFDRLCRPSYLRLLNWYSKYFSHLRFRNPPAASNQLVEDTLPFTTDTVLHVARYCHLRDVLQTIIRQCEEPVHQYLLTRDRRVGARTI